MARFLAVLFAFVATLAQAQDPDALAVPFVQAQDLKQRVGDQEAEAIVDKNSGRPIKMEAAFTGFNFEEFLQETTYNKFKDFGGIRKAMQMEVNNGDRERTIEITDFRILEIVDEENQRALVFVVALYVHGWRRSGIAVPR